jgi:hypothetical protein
MPKGRGKLKKAIKKSVIAGGGTKKVARKTARTYVKSLKAGSTPAQARKKSTSTTKKRKPKAKKRAGWY